ncbi:MAG: hypothetical protein IT542_03330 [Rubellimicrobium sp.]|nr:hypothetical protein [Rubellimicrobium sp.]
MTHPHSIAAIVAALFWALAALWSAPAQAQGAGFDCTRARSVDERAVCADPYLSALDRSYNEAFRIATGLLGRAQALAVARPTLVARGVCGADGACIEAVYLGALSSYARLGVEVFLPARQDLTGDPLPVRIGDCARSTIAWMVPRLDGDAGFLSGTAVRYANGGYQVSYDREAGIIGSAIGDPVQICLVSIPQGCPPGDDRGRVYATTNLATGQRWTLPDAQHFCGGA